MPEPGRPTKKEIRSAQTRVRDALFMVVHKLKQDDDDEALYWAREAQRRAEHITELCEIRAGLPEV